MTSTEYIDTQIISYVMKGHTSRSLKGCLISSIVANEFLQVQTDDFTKARFYVPCLRYDSVEHRLHSRIRKLYRGHAPIKRAITRNLSDRIIMDFGNDFPPIIEYNNLSIARAINEQNRSLFLEVIIQIAS